MVATMKELEEFGRTIGAAVRALGFAEELIAAEHAAIGKMPDFAERRRAISEARRLAGQKGKEARKARAAAGGKY